MIDKASKPKVFFIAYGYPPLQASGCVRARNITKYLSKLGWEVTVLTVEPGLWRRVDDIEAAEKENDELGIKRIYTGYKWACLSSDRVKYPDTFTAHMTGGICRRVAGYFGVDPFVGWYQAALQRCKELASNDTDVILATGMPYTSFEIAAKLSTRLGKPFVLDYRDPWSDDPHPTKRNIKKDLRRESAVLNKCALAITVSDTWANAIGRRFGVVEKMHVVSNGYDPDALSLVEPHYFDHPAIVYTGALFPPKRTLTPVLKVLKNLRKMDVAAKLHYYGPHWSILEQSVRENELCDWVVNHGSVSRSEALSAQKGAALGVVVASIEEASSAAENGIVTGKIFESIGMKVPVLGIAPVGCDLHTVIEQAGGGACFAGSDIDGMTEWVGKVIEGYHPQYNDPEAFSWPRLVQRLDMLLKKAIG